MLSVDPVLRVSNAIPCVYAEPALMKTLSPFLAKIGLDSLVLGVRLVDGAGSPKLPVSLALVHLDISYIGTLPEISGAAPRTLRLDLKPSNSRPPGAN